MESIEALLPLACCAENANSLPIQLVSAQWFNGKLLAPLTQHAVRGHIPASHISDLGSFRTSVLQIPMEQCRAGRIFSGK